MAESGLCDPAYCGDPRSWAAECDRGDKYLRTLLIHGARSVLTNSKSPPEWLTELMKRRPKNVAVVAMANKMARTIWALTAHERAYQQGYVSRPA
jgi:hypothetical protein